MATRATADELQEQLQNELKGRFTLIAPLGFTQRSFVYLATDPSRATPIALKIFPVDKSLSRTDVAAFMADAARIRSHEHPLLVPMLDFGINGQFLWYSRECAEGDSLDELIRKRAPLTVEESLGFVGQMTNVIGHLHSLDSFHGNVRPSNIFVNKSVARLTDPEAAFSINKVTSPQRRTRQLDATEFLAPEMFENTGVSAEADQYALAVVLFHCITGRLPYVGDSWDEMRRLHESAEIPLLTDVRKDVPGHVSQAVARAMAKNPEHRFGGVAEFGAALNRAPVTPTPSTSSDAERRSSQVVYIEPEEDEEAPRKSALRWLIPLVLLLVGGGVGSYLYMQSLQPEPPVDLESNWVASGLTPLRPSDSQRTQALLDSLPPVDSIVARDSLARLRAAAAAGSRSTPSTSPPVNPPRQAPRPVDRTPGQLSINSSPWGLVYLDGELLGNSPKVNIQVTPGSHVVSIVRVGFKTFTDTVAVSAGASLRLTDIVLEPNQ